MTNYKTILYQPRKPPQVKNKFFPVSIVKYYIPYLSRLLDKKRHIKNLIKNLTWSFLQKLFTALGG